MAEEDQDIGALEAPEPDIVVEDVEGADIGDALEAPAEDEVVPMPTTRMGPIGGIQAGLVEDDNWDCKTDKSFDGEAQLQAIDFDMHQLALHRFRIGDKYYQLNPNDEIFVAKAPCQPLQAGDNRCGTCLEPKFEDPAKDVINCQFCGVANCRSCCYKTRTFPRSALDKNGKQQKGKICMMCEKKFLIKKWLGKYMVKIKQDLKIEEGLQKKLNDLANRNKQVRYDSNCAVWNMTDQVAVKRWSIGQKQLKTKKLYIKTLKEIQGYRDSIHDIRAHLRSKFDEEEKAKEAEELEQLKKVFDPTAKKEKAAELQEERKQRYDEFDAKLNEMHEPEKSDEINELIQAFEAQYPDIDHLSPEDDFAGGTYQDAAMDAALRDALNKQSNAIPENTSSEGGCCSIF